MTDADLNNPKGEAPELSHPEALGGKPETDRHDALPAKTESGQHEAAPVEAEVKPQVVPHPEPETIQADAPTAKTDAGQRETAPVEAEVKPQVAPLPEPETIQADAPTAKAELSKHEAVPVEAEVKPNIDPQPEAEAIEADVPAPKTELGRHESMEVAPEAEAQVETEAEAQVEPVSEAETIEADAPAAETELSQYAAEPVEAEAQAKVDPVAEPEEDNQDAVPAGTWTFQHGALIREPREAVSEASGTEAEIEAEEPEAESVGTAGEASDSVVAVRHTEGVPFEAAHEAVVAEVHHPHVAEPDVVEPPPPVAPPGLIPPPAKAPEPNETRTKTAILLIGVVLAFVVLATLGVVGYVFYERLTAAPADSTSTAQEPTASTGAKDLGTVDSSAVGLKGHLTTKWDNGLGYNFVIEPDTPGRQAGFAAMASNPMRPATVTIQIKNSYGVVMCSQYVLLKFDPRKAAAIEEPIAEQPTGKRETKAAAAKEAEREADREADLDRQETDEANREQGKSFFQVNTGPSGTVDSISSQGQIPCPQSVYESMGYWSFLPDFPTPDEQADWAERSARAHSHAETTVDANTVAAPTDAPTASTRNKRAPNKAAGAADTFSIAGDDSIVEYDPASGRIGTRAGKVFSIERTGTAAHAMEGYDLPVKIHYSCDQTAACTLTRGGTVVAHARLSR
jgi:hypothetical protein